MTKSIFRVIALLAALLLSASLLLACTDDGEEETDVTSVETSALTAESDTNEESSSETRKEPVFNKPKPKDESTSETTADFTPTNKDGKDDIANDVFY